MALPVTSELLEQGFSAWAQDLSDGHYTKLPQTEIIPLVSVWTAVMAHEAPDRVSPREFTDDVLASEVASSALVDRLERGEARSFARHRDTLVPLARYDFYKGNVPWHYDYVAMHAGRVDEEFISIGGVMIAGLLGHAAYNSTSGGTMLSLEPFGPHPRTPELWKSLNFPRTINFVEAIE